MTARLLVDAGWRVHLIADAYPDDAQRVADERWLADGCAAGWILLSKDRRIRFRAEELASMHDGLMFCLASGNLTVGEMTARFLAAERHICRARDLGRPGFWHVHAGGSVRRMWP